MQGAGKYAAMAGMLAVLLASPTAAHAGLPDYVLEKDYQNCLGGDASDPDRAAYCNCIREGMRSWDIPTYLDAATQAAANAASGSVQQPGKLEELAKQCIARVMR